MVMPWSNFAWNNSYDSYASEGFAKNSIGFFAVSKIADKCGEIPLKLWKTQGEEKVEVTEHAVLDLLQNPNRNQFTYAQFVKAWVAYLRLSGNSYIFSPTEATNRTFPDQLFLIQPNHISVKSDKFGLPIMYEVRLGLLRS